MQAQSLNGTELIEHKFHKPINDISRRIKQSGKSCAGIGLIWAALRGNSGCRATIWAATTLPPKACRHRLSAIAPVHYGIDWRKIFCEDAITW